MRNNIVHIGAEELNYEIRQVVEIAHNVEQISGCEIFWENIGDPVQKGEMIPSWIKQIISQAIQEDDSYAYSPTHGLDETRHFLAKKNNSLGGAQVSANDIIFFNGLGDAINKIYYLLRREARVIGPSPAYPTHSSAEAAHAGSPPITYSLLPENNWLPDLDELRKKVKYNESISGIVIINPDNPTGAIFPKDVVREMIKIAKEYNLFIIADEIYTNMVYHKMETYEPVARLIEDVPALSLKGISKEVPWPGARCGWVNVYNRDKDKQFQKYIESIINAKQLEVCSTTLPQKVIPTIFSHPNYSVWQLERNAFFKKRSARVKEIFSECPDVVVNAPNGAYYVSVLFSRDLTEQMQLKIGHAKVRDYIYSVLDSKKQKGDFLFAYQLLGAKNICVVPLTSFVTNLQGFRCTLLERDDERFEYIYHTIAAAIKEFFSYSVR